MQLAKHFSNLNGLVSTNLCELKQLISWWVNNFIGPNATAHPLDILAKCFKKFENAQKSQLFVSKMRNLAAFWFIQPMFKLFYFWIFDIDDNFLVIDLLIRLLWSILFTLGEFMSFQLGRNLNDQCGRWVLFIKPGFEGTLRGTSILAGAQAEWIQAVAEDGQLPKLDPRSSTRVEYKEDHDRGVQWELW